MSTIKDIYLGAGCFWCVEAVFQKLLGVNHVESGYMGGHVLNPTYNDICTGLTGHAEVIKVGYDADVIPNETILEVFWHMHNPTTLNQQGGDRGTQYRSVIFYTEDAQKNAAESTKISVAQQIWPNPIVTEIIPAVDYYPGELYHQNYYNQNSQQSYCTYVIYPKLAKLSKDLNKLLKVV
jgi:peptide-methionine (S)-S-oxide reductase